MTTSIRERAGGVLLGQACGDALGVPYELGSAPLRGEPQMLGGGLGNYAPGEWSDDTQMAACIAEVAATGADLTSDDALDAVAERFLGWQQHGATDIGNQTRRVLTAARRRSGRIGVRLLQAAAEDLVAHPNSGAGNGALMRTSIVGLTRVDDREATAAAATAMARLTHPAADAVDSCVLWSEAVRRAVLDDVLELADGLDLLPARRRGRWASLITEAETSPPGTFTPNGWTVTAFQAAWSSIRHTPLGSHHLRQTLTTAISIGDDTDTVAAIAGGLLGARYGTSAIPDSWRALVHGWPGLVADDLVRLAEDTARAGRQEG